MAASGGVSYLWRGTRFSTDMVFGTGLRDDLALPDGSEIPNGDRYTPSYTQVNLGVSHEFRLTGSGPLTVRFDVINVLDKVYQIRSGSAALASLRPSTAAAPGCLAAWRGSSE